MKVVCVTVGEQGMVVVLMVEEGLEVGVGNKDQSLFGIFYDLWSQLL